MIFIQLIHPVNLKIIYKKVKKNNKNRNLKNGKRERNKKGINKEIKCDVLGLKI